MTTQNRAIVDKLLTDVSQKLTLEGFIAEDILPMKNVVQTSGKIGKYGKEFLRIETSVVGGNTKYPRITSTTRSSDEYLLTKHGLSDTVTEDDYDNVEQPFDAEVDATEDLTTKLQLEKEKGLADVLSDTGVITNNVTLSGTDQYSDYTNSDPIGDFKTARLAVKTNSGLPPDTVVMDWSTAETLRYHPALLELVKHTRNAASGMLDEELAFVLKVKRVLIGQVSYNNSVEGQTDVLAEVWGKNLIFMVAPLTASKKQTTIGYRVQKRAPRRVFKNNMENPPNSKEILVDDTYQQLITDANAAYLIKDTIA